MALSVSDFGETGSVAPPCNTCSPEVAAYIPSCKWCKRDKNFEQPLNHLKKTHPTICWRRPDGRECGICPA
eukprot:100522-Prorocentrum_lima.AAC.1